MKYSKDDLRQMTYKDYILLMAEELNNNGFTYNDGSKYEVGTNVYGDFVSDFSIGFVLSLKDKRAIEFLKEIGLLNNGRCPLTGLMLSDRTKTIYTPDEAPEISYDINTAWNEYTKIKRNWGCLISISIIVVGIIMGVISGFNTLTYIVLGIGAGGFVLSGMYGMSIFGNNWNKLCLSNEIGINAITLSYILKIKGFSGELDSRFAIKAVEYGIPTADFVAYMDWVRQQVYRDFFNRN